MTIALVLTSIYFSVLRKKSFAFSLEIFSIELIFECSRSSRSLVKVLHLYMICSPHLYFVFAVVALDCWQYTHHIANSQWCISYYKIISFTRQFKRKYLRETEGVFVGHLLEMPEIHEDQRCKYSLLDSMWPS